jgi:hypothetical protein
MKINTQSLQKISLSALLVLILGACGGSTSNGENNTNKNLQTEGAASLQNSSSNTSAGSQQKENKNLYAGTFETTAPAKDVTSSDNALFIAEGDKGVEVIQIGYNDKIEHNVITTITGINASKVSLSEDQTTLYVQNKEGFINVYDIQDIHAPRKVKILTKDSLQTNPVSRNGIYEYVPNEKFGMTIYDISNPANKQMISKFQETAIYALVLVDQGTKGLAATGDDGIALLDLGDPEHIQKLGDLPLEGKTLGISMNAKSGLLFVANGDLGIKVFNLNLLLDQLR